MFIGLFLSAGCCFLFPMIACALKEKVEPCWCLKIQGSQSRLDSNDINTKFNRETMDRRKQITKANDEHSNETKLGYIYGYSECINRCTSGNNWHAVYQVVIAFTIFILSIFSGKLGGFETVGCNFESFKRRNKFVDEIEQIKRWGRSMKPFAIMEQDWKIDWSSDIWLANNNAVETSSTVCIQYKKTQLKNTSENKH